MKKAIMVIFLLLTVMTSYSAADYGPYYVRDVNFCAEYELYLAPGNYIYGTEYGCAYGEGRAPSPFIGIFSLERNSFYLVEADPELSTGDLPRGSMMILEYNLSTMDATAYMSDGNYLEYYGRWEWDISLH